MRSMETQKRELSSDVMVSDHCHGLRMSFVAVVHSMKMLPPFVDLAMQLVNAVFRTVRDALDELRTETYIAPARPWGEEQFVKEVVVELFLLMVSCVLDRM